jgi:ParB family transcriptional regulator, chromosome partitioning protein
VEKAKRIDNVIHKINISDIIVQDRIRTRMGDLKSLALSLHIEGQLSPIYVVPKGDKFELVDGERRIRAAQSLGWSMLECQMYDSLSDVKKKEMELIFCVQREQLSFVEEARATKDLVERRRKEYGKGSLAKFGRRILNKDIAEELNMTESRMSENLRIADAVSDHPELETQELTRHAFLQKIRRGDFNIIDSGAIQKLYEENFLVMKPLQCMETIVDKIINLAILHPDTVDTELLNEVSRRLTSSGQVIVFTDHENMAMWETALRSCGLNVGAKPYIWNIKDKGDYLHFIWAGKNRTSPMRPIPSMLSGSTPHKALSQKAKPMQLLNYIIKCCTERGDFVVVPQCEDIETVRCCTEIGRNVRAACGRKVLRDQLIMSVVREEGE